MRFRNIHEMPLGSQAGLGKRPRLCYVITQPLTSRFLRGQLGYMRSRGYDVTLVSSPGKELDLLQESEGVDIVNVCMEREIHLLSDLRALLQLYRVFRNVRPQIVNAGTPKAGLLALLAAFFARVPIRIYTLRGLRLETATGVKRWVLSLTERMASACAHRVVAVSHSLADEYRNLGLVRRTKLKVLAGGSSNGVQTGSFVPTPIRQAQALAIRDQLGIAPGEPVIGYVGRLTRDKGIDDLVRAFLKLSNCIPAAWLLLVGEVESSDILSKATIESIRNHPRIIKTGFINDVARYYHVMNVLAFPSYREGFPNAVLEAQTAGIPVVGYRATGVVDAIVDGLTGRLVAVGAYDELAEALGEYVRCPELAAQHGTCGRLRVENEFSNERVWNALLVEYQEQCESMGLEITSDEACHQIGTRAA
jgi:glycosyltransferase involved in cell wall biosynthesis